MKYYIYTVLLLLLTASCSDDVQKWDQWPEWKLASPLSVGGQVLDEEIYSNFQGKKLHLDKGQEVEFSGIDEIESILSPDYFEYVSENKARFKGETADYSVLYDPANELLYIEIRGDLSGRIMVLRSQLGTSSSEAGYHKRLEYGRT